MRGIAGWLETLPEGVDVDPGVQAQAAVVGADHGQGQRIVAGIVAQLVAPGFQLAAVEGVGLAAHLGAVVMLLIRVIRSLFPPNFDVPEFWRNMYKMGNQSVPIVMLTAFFVGGIMVIQAAVFVKRFGATSMGYLSTPTGSGSAYGWEAEATGSASSARTA